MQNCRRLLKHFIFCRSIVGAKLSCVSAYCCGTKDSQRFLKPVVIFSLTIRYLSNSPKLGWWKKLNSKGKWWLMFASVADILNCQRFQICHFKEIKRREMHSKVADLICTRKAVKAVVCFYTWIANWKLLVQKWRKQSLPWEHVFHYRAVSLCLPEMCCRTFPGFKKWALLSWAEKCV